jgi:hypothetical protein
MKLAYAPKWGRPSFFVVCPPAAPKWDRRSLFVVCHPGAPNAPAGDNALNAAYNGATTTSGLLITVRH